MARPKIPTINWRSELNVLDEYIRTKGGVIHITTTEDSPSSAFCKSLRNIMEHGSWDKQWITVQIDGDNSSTHYLNDMIIQIETTLKLDPLPTRTKNNINIGSNINAGGDVEIRDVSVNLPFESDNQERIRRIVGTLQQSASEKRLAIFLFNTDSTDTDKHELRQFRLRLWENNLSKLIDEGILLIAFSHRNNDATSWLPDPDEVIYLPSEYNEQSTSHAIEDIAKFLLSQNLVETELEAKSMAVGMFSGHPTPKEIHARFAGMIAHISTC